MLAEKEIQELISRALEARKKRVCAVFGFPGGGGAALRQRRNLHGVQY